MDMLQIDRIDWNLVWKKQTNLWKDAAGKRCQEFWADEKSARVYAEKFGKRNQERIRETVDGLGLDSNSRVLDIGAGPGNLALPMAQTARSVTTVEPSFGMNRVMAQNMAEQKITNIIQVEKSWEDVYPDQDLESSYNLVLASMSLGMVDIKTAIEKMNQVCSDRVVVFWHAGIPEWEQMPKALWPDLFNMEYHGGPKSDVLFQVLCQMGIYPEIKVFTYHFIERFPTLDIAVAFYCKRFEQLQSKHSPMILAYLEEKCEKTDQGYVHGFDHQSMRFTWKPKEVCHEAV